MKLLAAVFTLLLLSACRAIPNIDLGAETRSLMAADEAFAALSEASTPKNAFASYLAPDAMMLPWGSQRPKPGPDG